MSWTTKFKTLFGALAVIATCLFLVLWLDTRRAVIASENAEISAESYTVGIDYSGLITRQYVEPGSMVEKDDTLFNVRSTTLIERINELDLEESALLYRLNEADEVVITATRPGMVSDIKYGQGSFAPANETLATIIDQQALEVVARYRIARRDFNKLATDSMLRVRLPGGKWTEGQIRNIRVTEQLDGQLLVEITADISEAGENSFRSATGVPVETRLQLNETTMYARLSRRLNGIF